MSEQSDRSLEKGKTDGQQRWLACTQCAGLTCHDVLASARTRDRDPETHMTFFQTAEIVECRGCCAISFRLASSLCQDIDWDDYRMFRPDEDESLYPKRKLGQNRIKGAESCYIPDQILRIYRETCHALVEDQPVLAGIGIRALVEAVCKEKGAHGSNLEAKIDNLVPMGILARESAEFLHATRLLGNKATHEVQAHAESDLGIALEIAEHLLMGVYVLPAKAQNLPKRSKESVKEGEGA